MIQRRLFRWLAIAACLAAPLPHGAAAQSLGIVADDSSKSVTVFDAETGTVLGTVALPQSPTASSATGGCVISHDQTPAFVTDFRFRVWVIDLAASPPRLADGTNPIPLSNHGQDLALTPDGRYLVACNGSNLRPVSLVDIQLRREVAAFNTGADTNTVDVCPDGSILVSSITQRRTRRLTIHEGPDRVSLQAEPGLLPFGGNNVYCAPGGRSGVLVGFNSRALVSFTIPELTPVPGQAEYTGDRGVSAVFNSTGTRLFVRSVNADFNQTGFVDVFEFDPATGRIGLPDADAVEPLLTFPVDGVPPAVPSQPVSVYYGFDQMALGPAEDRLYVPERDRIGIYDATTGAPLGQIVRPGAVVRPTGIAIARTLAVVEIDVEPDSPDNRLNLRNKHPLRVAVLSSPAFDAASLDDATVRLVDPEQLLSGALGVAPWGSSLTDVNGDGLPDRLYEFDKQTLRETGAIVPSSTLLMLFGQTRFGRPIAGTDTVTIIGAEAQNAPGKDNANGPKK